METEFVSDDGVRNKVSHRTFLTFENGGVGSAV